jgi:hypothetical protein
VEEVMMGKNRFTGIILLLLMVLMLNGCGLFNSKDKIVLTLKVNGVLYDKMQDLATNTTVSLPIVSEDNQVFIGWGDGESTYFDTYLIEQSTQLEAIFEDVGDHFTYSVREKNATSATLIHDTISIDTYIGDANYLVVPKTIDGKYVSVISPEAFLQSSVVHIHIPADVELSYHSFYNATHLESLRYYGDLEIPYEDTFNHLELSDILSQQASVCSQNPDDRVVGTYPFGDSCPIIEISHIQSLNLGGQPYTNYRVVLDPIIPQDFKFTWTTAAFEGATNLHTLEIPKADTIFFMDSLLGTPNIKTLIVHESNPYFTLLDGVLFSKDLTQLLYYPSGKQDKIYTVPSGATYITGLVDNIYIETLNINDFVGAFPIRGMTGLKEILVGESNTRYQSMDGILYQYDTLVSYPANKAGEMFLVPNHIKNVGNYAFHENRHLVSVDLNQVTNIGVGVFMASKSITELHLPSTVTRIGIYLTAESSITSLFVHRSFVVDGNITQLTSNTAFNGSNFMIYVPDDSLDTYKAADYWKNFADLIHPISEFTA